MRSLFGNHPVEDVSGIFKEIGKVISTLQSQADHMTDEEYWSEHSGDVMKVMGQGMSLTITIQRLRQLEDFGCRLAMKAKRPAHSPIKKGRHP